MNIVTVMFLKLICYVCNYKNYKGSFIAVVISFEERKNMIINISE